MDYEQDIVSDLSAIHRIDDPWKMPALKFVSFVERLIAYPGIIHALAQSGHLRFNDSDTGQPMKQTEFRYAEDKNTVAAPTPESQRDAVMVNENFIARPANGFPAVFDFKV